VDLARSFNFFRREDREFSSFNLRRVDISAVHDLGDWELSVSYGGTPEVVTEEGVSSLQWTRNVSVVLEWKPIPEIRTEIEADEEGFQWDDQP
jgi:hypothetical protein